MKTLIVGTTSLPPWVFRVWSNIRWLLLQTETTHLIQAVTFTTPIRGWFLRSCTFPINFMWWRTDSEACLLYFVAGFQRSFIPVSTQFSAFSPFLSCLGQLWFWTPFYASSCNVLIVPQTYPSSCNVLIVPQTYPSSCDVWVGFIVCSLHLILMKLLANYIHCQCPIFSLKYSDLPAWFWLYFFQYAAIYHNERIFNIPRSIFHINCMSLSWRIHHILHLYWENSNISCFTFHIKCITLSLHFL